MKTFEIIYVEHIYHTFYVEANSEDEARKEFNRMASMGELDFSDGEVFDSGIDRIDEEPV